MHAKQISRSRIFSNTDLAWIVAVARVATIAAFCESVLAEHSAHHRRTRGCKHHCNL